MYGMDYSQEILMPSVLLLPAHLINDEGRAHWDELTLLTLCIVDTQAEQRWSLAPQRGNVAGGQLQLEHWCVHVLGPEYIITIMRNPKWVVQFFAIVHHLWHEEAYVQCCNQTIQASKSKNHRGIFRLISAISLKNVTLTVATPPRAKNWT